MWEILGIKQTKDKDLIKKAYRNQLLNVNPEDDPKGFMRLREAYEDAMKYSDLSDEDEALQKKDGEIIDCPEEFKELLFALKDLYRDYNSRIDEEVWKEFLNRDEFVSLDTSSGALELLLRFLMDNFLLPQKIWKVIIDTFYIIDRKKELEERFPEDFISYIIDNSENPDIFNYYLFDNDIDNERVDDFIKTYLNMNNLIRKKDTEGALKLIEALESYDIYHPYIEYAGLLIDINSSQDISNEELIADILEKLENLYSDFQDDYNFAVSCGDFALLLKNYEKAEKYYNIADDIFPNTLRIKAKYADFYFEKGEYEKSRDSYMELLRENNYENSIRAGMLRANYKLIEKYEDMLKENPDDNDTRIEMAWSLYQSYRFDEAVKVLDEFIPSEEKYYEYYNVKGRCYLCLLDYENALYCFFRWREAIEKLPDDNDTENLKKKKRYPYVNCLIGDCYLKKGMYNEARKYLNMAISEEHDEICIAYEALCELEYKTGNYETCISTCEKLLEYNELNYIAYDYMASSCIELKFIKEALDACEKAIRIYPYAPDPYLKEIKIFNALNNDEAVKNIIKKYKSLGVESDRIRVEEANVLLDEGKYDEAIDILLELANADANESDLEDKERVYSLISLCYVDKNMPNEAIEYLKKIIDEIDEKHVSAYGRIGVIYRRLKNYNSALSYLTKQISINAHPYFYMERALVYRYMGNYRDAVYDYESVIKKDPQNVEAYRELANAYERISNFVSALLYIEQAIDYTTEIDKKGRLYIQKARILQCMKDYMKAKMVYETYISEVGISYDLLYDYAELLQRKNEIDKAIELLKENLDEITDEEEKKILLRKLCTIYGEEGYINLAKETFDVIINKYPNDCKTYKLMADIFKDHRLYEEATKYYLKAIELDNDGNENYYSSLVENEYSKKGLFKPDMKNEINKGLELGKNAVTILDYIKLARLYRVTKKYKLAIETLNKGISLQRCYGCFYRECHEAYYEKGLTYEAMRKYDMARDCYRKALSIKGHCTQYEESLKRIEGK